MTEKQLKALALRDTDIQGSLERFGGNESLYISCLLMFLKDPTMAQINKSIEEKNWNEAFTAVHALKGLAGNMGFVPLMHSTGKLVVLIRGGKTNDIDECLESVNSNYRNIVDAIQNNFIVEKKEVINEK